jgi:hypothetical protein
MGLENAIGLLGTASSSWDWSGLDWLSGRLEGAATAANVATVATLAEPAAEVGFAFGG